MRLKRFEPLTHGLEGRCSIQLSYRRILDTSPIFGGICLRPLSKNGGAGDGNRTHATSLEGWNSTIELHPHLCDFGAVSTTLVYNSTYPKNCQIFFALFFIFSVKNFNCNYLYQNSQKMLKTNSKKIAGENTRYSFSKTARVCYNKGGNAEARNIYGHFRALIQT